MFQNLKTKNSQQSVFLNGLPMTHSFSRAPGTDSSVTKINEADRRVRCRICGWICDKERDVRIREGAFAGIGVGYSAQLTAGSAIGDVKTPAAGSVSGQADRYYDRTVSGGCPCCGSYLFDPDRPIQQIPELQ